MIIFEIYNNYEKYQDDSNLFNLIVNDSYNNNDDKTYKNELIESYDGKEIENYLINQIVNMGNSKGMFIINPEKDHSKTFYIILIGILSSQ